MRHLIEQDRIQIITLLQEGMTLNEVAKRVNCSVGQVRYSNPEYKEYISKKAKENYVYNKFHKFLSNCSSCKKPIVINKTGLCHSCFVKRQSGFFAEARQQNPHKTKFEKNIEEVKEKEVKINNEREIVDEKTFTEHINKKFNNYFINGEQNLPKIISWDWYVDFTFQFREIIYFVEIKFGNKYNNIDFWNSIKVIEYIEKLKKIHYKDKIIRPLVMLPECYLTNYRKRILKLLNIDYISFKIKEEKLEFIEKTYLKKENQ